MEHAVEMQLRARAIGAIKPIAPGLAAESGDFLRKENLLSCRSAERLGVSGGEAVSHLALQGRFRSRHDNCGCNTCTGSADRYRQAVRSNLVENIACEFWAEK
jgi:DNA-binding transcriptional regulator LsrR (DeoR family)